ncbi:putative N-acetyltransferase YjcF [compost metagenome]
MLSEYRGKAYGLKIVQAMEQDVKRRGYSRAVLDAQCTAEAFYQRLGYKTVSTEPFLDAGIWHVRMEHIL